MTSGQPVSLSLATEKPATSGSDVFIPLDKTVEKLKALINRNSGSRFFFFRAPVASGKSTLAKYMCTSEKYKKDFVLVFFGSSEEEWKMSFIEASGLTLQPAEFVKAILSIGKRGLTIVIDEAHLLFNYPAIWEILTKQLDLRDDREVPKFVLFSASGSSAITETTPAQVSQKYLWYPPVPDGKTLVSELKRASKPISLTPKSVSFFFQLCGGHRGIFMMAMEWVQHCQDKESGQKEEWDLPESVSYVRSSFDDSRMERSKGPGKPWTVGLKMHFKKSRAVRVNGDYSDLSNIPKEFAKVLFGGPQTRAELKQTHRELTKAGFIFPERRSANENEEFVKFDWTEDEQCYAIANPILSKYYGDIVPPRMKCKRKLVENLREPTSAADLLARVVPFLTFDTVVDNPIVRTDGGFRDPLSGHNLPFEDHYNDAIAKVLSDEYLLNYSVSRPQNPLNGKTDVVVRYGREPVTGCAIEAIMAWREEKHHIEHIERFLNPEKANYADARHKAFVIIGNSRSLVKRRVDTMAKEYQDKEGAPEIIGLFVTVTHTRFEMFLPGEESHFFACDMVAKSMKLDGLGRWIPAQVCEFEPVPKRQRQKNDGDENDGDLL